VLSKEILSIQNIAYPDYYTLTKIQITTRILPAKTIKTGKEQTPTLFYLPNLT
jgi:hypothetical protein